MVHFRNLNRKCLNGLIGGLYDYFQNYDFVTQVHSFFIFHASTLLALFLSPSSLLLHVLMFPH